MLDKKRGLIETLNTVDDQISKMRDSAEKDHTEWEEKKAWAAEVSQPTDEIMRLRVGGEIIEASKRTLVAPTGTRLAEVFSGVHPLKVEKDGTIFVDDNSGMFKSVLTYIKQGEADIDFTTK
mmetsp:Transcript_33389/g.51224  ORF Transcript_33389/g.51224 Transcript_33389/m.51224 type:complete len:122 (-) Transcript_33389:554-919(-)|eukprot:CAMPEP_0170505854 /NCGR_PEP_ID=MMETSP0208-20121228/52506_1 /TAXON_ID=197538 /ORGANISM="Strombidium inclinatum, Strain S3" /LENGTH=121 /DNA_ID=CAMNT_0010786993 /DNA_START=402 /DNA_END=767 /DNA_ORIENTATION=+